MQELQQAESIQQGMAGGKFMAFRLSEEIYGLSILEVREIIGLMAITHVPRCPEHIRGVINLRGKVIPVLDLRLSFGMDRIDNTETSVIIVVQCEAGEQQRTMGILVDEVLEVLSIEPDQVEPPPAVGMAVEDAGLILGVGKSDQRVIFLLDTRKVITLSAPTKKAA